MGWLCARVCCSIWLNAHNLLAVSCDLVNAVGNIGLFCQLADTVKSLLVTFPVGRSRDEMYIVHGHLSVCLCILSVCLSLAAFPHCCMDPDITFGNGSGCPLIVHYWVDLQSVHGFRCYDNIAPNTKCQRVLVLAPCLVAFACGSAV